MLIAQGVNPQYAFLEVLSRAVTSEASFPKFNSPSMALSYQCDIIPTLCMDGKANPKKYALKMLIAVTYTEISELTGSVSV